MKKKKKKPQKTKASRIIERRRKAIADYKKYGYNTSAAIYGQRRAVNLFPEGTLSDPSKNLSKRDRDIQARYDALKNK